MSDPNQLNTNPETDKEPSFDIVQFKDGAMALVWKNPGEVLSQDYRDHHKYLRDLGDSSYTIIRTESGNAYGIGGGVAVNARTRQAFTAPHQSEIPDITIGRPLDIPGVGSTTAVSSVYVEYKVTTPGSASYEQIDAPNPFAALHTDIGKIQEQLN